MCRPCEVEAAAEERHGVSEDHAAGDEGGALTDGGSIEAVEAKIDELNDGLLEAFAAGFSQAVETFGIDANFNTAVSALTENDALVEQHWYYWDGRSKPLEYWLREEVASDQLTRKQREALQAAVRMGYFDVPRRANQGDLSDLLGVSEQAVSERLRRASQTMVSEWLAAGEGGDA